MEEKAAGMRTPANTAIIPKKVSNPIATESQWSLGWNGTKDLLRQSDSINHQGFSLYHNHSAIFLGENHDQWNKEEVAEAKIKTANENAKPVWNYDPKRAGQTTMILGGDKPDYRKKDEFYRVRTATKLTGGRHKWCTNLCYFLPWVLKWVLAFCMNTVAAAWQLKINATSW